MIRLRYLSIFRFIYNFEYLLRDGGGLSNLRLHLPDLCCLFDLTLPLRLEHLQHDLPLDEAFVELVFLNFHQRHANPLHRLDWLTKDTDLGIPMEHEARELPHQFTSGAPDDSLVA